MKLTVRTATLLDLLLLAPLAERYAEEAQKHENFPIDMEHLVGQAAAATLSEDSCILICFKGKEPIGLLWGHCSSLPWSKSKLAYDTILYVTPETRKKSKAGYLLMKAWNEWAAESGASEVQISIASGIHEEETIRFYKRMGYSLIGSQYRKEC